MYIDVMGRGCHHTVTTAITTTITIAINPIKRHGKKPACIRISPLSHRNLTLSLLPTLTPLTPG